MLPIKIELHTTSAPHKHRTSCQRTTKQNQKNPGTHQIKLRQSCRKYSTSKAGDSVAHLRIACRRQMLPIKHKLHTASTQHITLTHNNTKSKEPWNSPNEASSMLQEIQLQQGW
jgi:hypothetical protein